MKIIILGGGAAGFFAAIRAKKVHPSAQVILYEKTAKLLSKVRISGGGRCNVTHALFDPKKLILHYPRGSIELLGPFHRFQPLNTVEWFSKRGVPLKKEKDGRMFPVTNSSETIINCLLGEAKKLGVEIQLRAKLDIMQTNYDRFILATGSSKEGWEIAKSFGHTIQEPVPSLFTFNVPDSPLKELAGTSCENVKVRIEKTKFSQEGPLLITHWGFSGPAILKLSAFAARYLAEKNYETTFIIDWVPALTEEKLFSLFSSDPKKHLQNVRTPLPKRLWSYFCQGLNEQAGKISKTLVKKLCHKLKNDRYTLKGKTTNKEEFVTCGGVTLSEVNFKTMESKIHPNVFFCGEVLDIDGITGGFNFQNAWTTGWIAGSSV